MSQNEFVGFLATVSATTALGIDMVLPAFGNVREAFGLAEDSTQVALTVTLYFLGLAVAQIFYGPLTDRFGRKPVLLVSLSLYVIAALASGLAPNLPTLLLARLAWGMAAAGPRVLLMAIARDVYDGDRLARVLSLASAIFMIVPALAPLIGQAVLGFGSWRLVFAAPLVPAIALMLWSSRLEESLPVESRRPLTLTTTATAFKAVTSDRKALGFSLALMFDFAAFASFLSSTELLFDRVYDRSAQFALLFGVMSTVMGLSAFVGSKVVSRFGAVSMIVSLLRFHMITTTVLVVVSLLAGGRPSFWLWFGLITIGNAVRTLINPLSVSEAMQSMGDLAGTAASVVGVISMGGGALLAGITDRFIRDTVSPLSGAYFIYGFLELVAVMWAIGRLGPSRRSSSQAHQDQV